MSDATAAKQAPQLDRDRLTLLFTIYNARLVRTLRARLGANWALADDLAQDTWIRVSGSLHTCRATDDRTWPWISTLAYRAMADHFRLARNSREVAADFGGDAAGMLPPSHFAEDIVVSRIITQALAADFAVPLGVAA